MRIQKLTFCLLLLLPLGAAAQGIQFETGTWAEILAKAKATDKIVFLDAYTSWCGPCKLMSKNTFPDPAVGALYNARYVNAKIDMEKGEGPSLLTKYGVEFFPTLLFIDGNGELVHKAVGYYQTADFLELGKKADNPKVNLRGLKQRYDAGDRKPETLLAYTYATSAAFDPVSGQIANEYMKTQKDFGTDENMEFIYNYVNDPYSDGFKYFVWNQDKFAETYTEELVATKIENTISEYVSKHPELTLADIRTLFVGAYPKEGERMAGYYAMNYYAQHEDYANYANAAIAYFDTYPAETPEELNEAAWNFYVHYNDTFLLEKAVEWAKQSVRLGEAYYNRDTLAALFAKLGRKNEAIAHAQRAIELAKAEGEDYSSTQKMLDQLTKQ
jgi:thioredoxin-related protein